MTEIVVLRLVHILGGIFWVGSGLFTAFFLLPVLGRVGPAAGPVMAGLQARRLYSVLPAAAVLTMLSGLRLMWITSAGFSAPYFASAPGRAFTASAIAAVVAFVLSLAVARPAALRAASLGRALAGADEGARGALARELDSARKRSSVATAAAVALLLFAASGMAVARYLR